MSRVSAVTESCLKCSGRGYVVDDSRPPWPFCVCAKGRELDCRVAERTAAQKVYESWFAELSDAYRCDHLTSELCTALERARSGLDAFGAGEYLGRAYCYANLNMDNDALRKRGLELVIAVRTVCLALLEPVEVAP